MEKAAAVAAVPESPPEVPPRPATTTLSETLNEILAGFERWPLWTTLAWQDIKNRYRRSVLGPLWLTLSMGILVGGLGFLYSVLLKTDVKSYFPFLSLGMITWGMIATIIGESVNVFVENAGIIKQVKLPLTVYVFRLVLRNIIIFLHNMLIYVIIKFVFDVQVGWHFLLLPISLLLVAANATWFALLIGAISTRFRDLQQIVLSALQVIFFLTPVVWPPSNLQHRARVVFADNNPFAHTIELVRQPLIGNMPELRSWIMVTGLAIVGWLVTFTFLHKKGKRIAFWV